MIMRYFVPFLEKQQQEMRLDSLQMCIYIPNILNSNDLLSIHKYIQILQNLMESLMQMLSVMNRMEYLMQCISITIYILQYIIYHDNVILFENVVGGGE